MEPSFKLSPREKTGLVLRYLGNCWSHFLTATLCACLSMLLGAATPQIIRITVDSILGTQEPALPGFVKELLRWDSLAQQPRQALVVASVAVLVVAVFRGLFSYGERLEMAKGTQKYLKSIRDDLYCHIQRLPFAWHKANPTGDIIQRCTSDVDVIRNFACSQLLQVFRTVFLIVLYLSIMFAMNVRLSLIALIFIPVVGLSSAVFYRLIANRFKAADEAEGELTTCAQENLTAVRVVRAFGRERHEEEKFNGKNEFFSALWIKLGKLMSVYWASGTLLTCLQVMVIVIAGAVEAVNGDLTLGDFLVFVSYNSSLAWPVRALGRVLADMSKAGVSMDRVGYILQAAEEKDSPDAVEAVTGDIEFRHVTFAYEGQDVLRDVSFTIREGETFAILGSTGSGKSTIVHLLDRLYDLPEQGGEITIGGVDIRTMRRDSLRSQVGLVLQEPFLFSRTVGENICATRPDATEEEMRRAAAIACVDEAINTFADGYDTVVGERGVTLSGGQKQRVAIARMLMQQAPILIFDDSLSAVDAETDAKIRAALRDTLQQATVILVSHRVTTLMQADRILVLEDGRVSDIGTHAELISRPGLYKDIYDIQMRSDDRALILEGGEV